MDNLTIKLLNPEIVAGLLIILLSIAVTVVTTKYIETPIRNTKFNKLAFKRIGFISLINILLITGLVSHNQYVKIQDKKAVANKDYPGALSINLDKDKIKENKPKPEFANVFDDLPQSHLENSNQSMSKSEVKVGEYGKQKDYKATIALVESSHSEHWLGAVIKAAEENDYRVINITRSGTRFSTGYKENTLQDDWVENVENYLEKADDIVLVLSHVTASDTESEKIQQQMVDQLLKVKNNYDIEVMAIKDIPRYDFNVSEELEKHGEKDTIERMNKGNRQLDEAFWEQISNEEKDLPQFDPSEYFKVNGKYRPIIGNIVIYRDMDHMTNTYSETFGPILGDEIKKVVQK